MLLAISVAIAAAGLIFGGLCGYRLYHWERQLRGARIGIFYKGKLKMDPPLIDFLKWANSLEGDSRTGRGVYQFGATTVTILKRRPPSKAKTTTRKEEDNGRTRTLHNLAKRSRTQSPSSRSKA